MSDPTDRQTGWRVDGRDWPAGGCGMSLREIFEALDALNPDNQPETAHSFWPPQVGDVWLGRLAEPSPKAWVCHKPGILTGVHDWTCEETWRKYGPLRLVWRHGQAVTAHHVSQLPAAEGGAS